MSNDIINLSADQAGQNADEQEVLEETPAATTNSPVDANSEEPNIEEPKNEIAEVEVAELPQQSFQEPETKTAHDDFDWSVDKRNVTSYNAEERKTYDGVYDSTFKQINDGEMIHGIVVALTKTDVVVNIGFKSDGLVSLNEFRDMPTLKVGDDVEVMVAEKEDREGNLHLSRKQARTTRAWERIVEMHKSG